MKIGEITIGPNPNMEDLYAIVIVSTQILYDTNLEMSDAVEIQNDLEFETVIVPMYDIQ